MSRPKAPNAKPNTVASRPPRAAAESVRSPLRVNAAGGDDIHRDDTLRRSAEHLIAHGDLDLSIDGQVRPQRVDTVRRNLGNGAYDRRDVIAGIVDRLLEQWQI